MLHAYETVENIIICEYLLVNQTRMSIKLMVQWTINVDSSLLILNWLGIRAYLEEFITGRASSSLLFSFLISLGNGEVCEFGTWVRNFL